ncbi:Transglutaminase-like enzymes, putative cysteine proteases [Microbacterium esteraromaticum]|uniref:Transglutaminase-like enzymes, putative cysteine proteases n=1 Tax=Microbacterium esteraromaticum TaxID=57043 RepID=A0A1R4KPL8_9MICO|nr:transglutaminase-like domain-containing protein [Microbacterium esteraromaticum]SJN46240.1 Transglutaminase-like enzymes, putative cysteine proteases [Microbacterium esteraromaticum]
MTAVSPSPALSIRRWVLDLAAVAVLLAVALLGFWPTFGGGSFGLAAAGGVLLGIAIAAVCTWRGWGILIVAGLTIAAYFVFGGAFALSHTAIAGFIPTLDTLGALALGAVTAWKQLLTTVAPVSAADGHLLVPFLIALVAAVTAASLALRLRHVGWALAPIIGAFVLVIALGVPDPAFPVVQGIILAGGAVTWMSLRAWWVPSSSAVDVSQVDPTRAAHMRLRRVLSGVAVVAVAAGAGVAVSAASAPAEPRHIFRDAIVPPFNVRDYVSPLQSFRKNVRDQKEKTLFTVSGLPKGARVRLAAMDEWDGVVFNVADGGPGSSSAFTPLRSNMAADAEGVPVSLRFEIGDYDGVWVPSVEVADDFAFDGDHADALRRSAYSNTGTGTTVVVDGLKEGDAYTLRAIVPAAVSDEQLKDAAFANIRMPKATNVPEDLSNIAADAVTDAETPIEQVRALETHFAEDGFFSHGLEGEVLSRAGHTAERIATLLGGDQMIGDDEQYAAVMALAARELGIPARVVMGYYPEEEQAGDPVFTATGDDVHAWVEVAFEDFGWVPFSPTPPKDKVPNDTNTKPRVDPKPQVLQPPPPPQEPIDLPPTVPDDRKPQDETPNILGIIGVILAIGGISLGVLLLLASPFIVIGAWKASKRRSRRNADRTSDRISGGWDELTDRAVDYGARLAPGATRIEEAATVSAALTVPSVTALADRADGQVFGPDEPSQAEVDSFWQEIETVVGGLGKDAGFFKRMKARVSIRSLTGSGRMSVRMQELKAAATARVRREPGNIEHNSTTSESETP